MLLFADVVLMLQKYSFSEYITGQEYVSCRSTDDGFRVSMFNESVL